MNRKNTMKNKIKKMLAVFAITAMTASNLQPAAAYASNNYSASQVSTIEQNEVSDDFNTENRLNYIYVQNPYVETPGTQNIVVSWGDGTETITNIRITVQKEDGTTEEWSCANHAENLYLFSKEYADHNEQSTYKVVDIKFKRDGTEQSIALADAEAIAEFGVNKAYEGIEELQPLDPEQTAGIDNLETSIVTIGENGKTKSQNSIAEALSAVNEEMCISPVAESDTETAEKSGEIVVALDPGHDNKHGGAIGYGLVEQELTLKIANYAKTELEKYCGVKVYLTRTNNNCPYPTVENSGKCIEQRIIAASKAGAKIFVSFHLNTSPASGPNGAEVIIPNTSWKPQYAAEGRALAEKILAELAAVGLNKRPTPIYSKDTTISEYYPDGSKSDYFSVHIYGKENNVPSIIVENAFLSNSNDVNKFLKTEAGLKKIGVANATGIAKYLNLKQGYWEEIAPGKWCWNNGKGIYAKNAWILIGNDYYWVDAEGYRVTGFYEVAGTTYYFNSVGVMQKGWQKIQDNWYYFNSTGGMYTGWREIDNNWYYFYSDGVRKEQGWLDLGYAKFYINQSAVMVTGLHTIDGEKYYFISSGQMQTNCWKTVSGKTYYFGADGKAVRDGWYIIDGQKYLFNSEGVQVKSGWVKVPEGYYYIKSDGTPAIGWLQLEGYWYYFHKDGLMQNQGWLDLGYAKFYINQSGIMETGLKSIDGEKYYFISSGQMQVNCWKTINGKTYYFGADGKAVKNGWHVIGGKKYLFNSEGVQVKNGWAKVPGGYYYIKSDGTLAIGWLQLEGYWYYFHKDGLMQNQGWLDMGYAKFYINQSGIMETGLKTIGGEKYYFISSGQMQTNCWKTLSGKTYYFGADGKAVKNKVYVIAGKKYVFNSEGAQVKSGWAKLPEGYYYIKKDGTLAIGWLQLEGYWYYFHKDGLMQNQGWLDMGYAKFYINQSGIMETGLKTIGGEKYYFISSGQMQTKCWKTVSGKTYYFGADGKAYRSDWHMVGGVWYYFEETGEWNSNPPTQPPSTGRTPIIGKTTVTAEQMAAYYQSKKKVYPEYYVKNDKEATSILKFCQIFIEEANAQGIPAEIAFSQSMKETGWLQFQGTIKPEQNNFAGIGATDNGAQGAYFPSVRIGIRAQIQHLFAYATEKKENELVYECVDPRFQYVKRGAAPYIEWLGIQENPNGTGWASGENYGRGILKIMAELKAYK